MGPAVPPGGTEGMLAGWCMPPTLQAAHEPPSTNSQELPEKVTGGWIDTRMTG